MDTSVLGAFLLGILGSFHCVGMCAPIALALPQVGAGARGGEIWAATLYNLGRVVSYAAMGFIVGELGRGVLLLGFIRGVSIVLGLLLILSVFLPSVLRRFSLQNSRVYALLTRVLAALMQRPSYSKLWLIGVLNGFLPCGLVYTALAGAVLSMNGVSGALYMLFFGLGTLPLMWIVAYSRRFISLLWRRRLQRVVPVVVVLMGLWLLVRGLNLGLPFLSPMLDTATEQGAEVRCH